MIQGKSRPRELIIEATVHRADGTVEELGRVAYWHKNPLMRLAHRVKEMRRGNIRR